MKKPAGLISWELPSSPVGRILVCCSSKGVRAVEFASTARKGFGAGGGAVSVEKPKAAAGRNGKAARLARQTVSQLREYFVGRRVRFSVPLDVAGTAFQRRVWEALRRIPYGETRSYQDIARQVGNPLAARAVGMANRANPVAILVPCHRVISSDGSLGGYAGGIKIKSCLLRLERGALRRRRRQDAGRQSRSSTGKQFEEIPCPHAGLPRPVGRRGRAR